MLSTNLFYIVQLCCIIATDAFDLCFNLHNISCLHACIIPEINETVNQFSSDSELAVLLWEVAFDDLDVALYAITYSTSELSGAPDVTV